MAKQDRRYIIIEAMGEFPAQSNTVGAATPPPTARSGPPMPNFKRFGVEAAAVRAAPDQPVTLQIHEEELSEAQVAEVRQSISPDRRRMGDFSSLSSFGPPLL